MIKNEKVWKMTDFNDKCTHCGATYSFKGGDNMAANKETLIKRFESTAETFEKKGKREWAYAKNGHGDEHYGKARDAFDRANRNREKADKLRNE